jgi:hypothetical protein
MRGEGGETVIELESREAAMDLSALRNGWLFSTVQYLFAISVVRAAVRYATTNQAIRLSRQAGRERLYRKATPARGAPVGCESLGSSSTKSRSNLVVDQNIYIVNVSIRKSENDQMVIARVAKLVPPCDESENNISEELKLGFVKIQGRLNAFFQA